MEKNRLGLLLPLITLIILAAASTLLAQSTTATHSGAFDVEDLEQPFEKYEVFLSEGKFLVQITVTVNPESDADVELRDEGFGGTVRARVLKGTTKTIVLTTKLLAVRPTKNQRAFGTYQLTVLGPAEP